MKSGILKYIFFIFIIVIVIYAIFIIRKNEKVEEIKEKVVELEKVNQELKLGIANFDTINPLLSNNKYVQDISKLIYEPLITLKTDYELEPCLAEEWAKTANNIYVIKINKNVTWENGEKLKVDDVIFTIQKLQQINSIYTPNVQNISFVEAIDDSTIKITLNQENPFFEYNLTFPIMNKNYCENEDFIESDKVKKTIGTGSYKISNIEQNGIILEQNGNWWNKDKKENIIEKINIKFYSSVGEIYNDFKLGKLDYISTNNINIEEYIGTIGYNKVEAQGRELDYLSLNVNNKVLKNKEVRQAIMYAIDKKSLIDNVYNSKYMISDFPLNNNWINNKESINYFNTDKCYQILKDNGWEFKYNYWQKYVDYYTRRLSFNLVVNKDNYQRVKVAELIKQQLEVVGIKITIIYATQNQYNSYLQNKNYDMILSGSYLSPNIDLSYYFGDGNSSNYYNEEVRNILHDIKNITDKELLINKYQRLYEIIIDEVPSICLYTNYSIVAYNKNLIGSMSANWFNQFYNINSWSKK